MDELTLRPLQTRFVGEINSALRRSRKVCGVAPTGFGKAVIVTYYAGKVTEKGRRLLIVTNRRILIEQLGKQCRRYGVPFGIIMADEPRNDSALVQVASVQTLKIRKWKDLPTPNGIIWDECHNEAKSSHILYEMFPEARCLGVTATPVGPSGKSLVGLYDEILEPVKNDELIAGKWLLPTKCYAPSEPDIQGVWIDEKGVEHKGVDVESKREFNQQQLAAVVESCTVFADVFKWWQPYSHMQTIVFVPRVKYAYGMAQQFEARGFKAAVIEGATKTKERDGSFTDFNSSSARVLVAVDVLREGFDAPIAQVGIDLQPCYQFRTFWQKLGRVRRPHPGQSEAIWLDFAGNLWRHGVHPDDNPPWAEVIGDKTTADVLNERAGRRCKVCGSDYIVRGRCQDCGADCSNGKKPWQCSACKYSLSPWERLIDGKCPNCGQKVGKCVRTVRMANGQMRVVPADEIKRRKKSKATSEQKLWDACRYKAMYSGKTLDFAKWLFQQDSGNSPNPAALKNCPPVGSGDWKRKPADVYPWMDRRRKQTPNETPASETEE